MKNKKRKIIIILIIFIILFCVLLGLIGSKSTQINYEENNEIKNYEKEYEDMKNNSIMYEESSTVEQLKEEYKITGKEDIYQIETENDGRKVITVKPTIEYKVAFCGMVKNSKPEMSELDSIYEEKNPTENGIWIKQSDREKILKYLNNNKFTKAKYQINNKGFLNVIFSDDGTDVDKKIQDIINGDKQYIFCISSLCYMIDTVTGEIVDNPYNELEEYQTYEYFKDENRMIIFITENKSSKMSNDEIFESIIDLISL